MYVHILLWAHQAKQRQKAGELKFEELCSLHAFDFLLDEASNMEVEALSKGLVAGLSSTDLAPIADQPAKKKAKVSLAGSSQLEGSDNSVMALFA